MGLPQAGAGVGVQVHVGAREYGLGTLPRHPYMLRNHPRPLSHVPLAGGRESGPQHSVYRLPGSGQVQCTARAHSMPTPIHALGRGCGR